MGPQLVGLRRPVREEREVAGRGAQARRPPRDRVAHARRRVHVGVHGHGRDGRARAARVGRRGPEAREREKKFRRSILDFVTEDTRLLQGTLGPTDRRKLDEYLTSIREVERQIEKAESEARVDPHMDKPYGVPADFAEHFRLMADMMSIAFQADLTRVATFLVTHEGTSRAYRELGMADGHHPLTHHRNNVEMMDKVTQINTYHTAQFSAWMQRMKASQEGDGSVLDNSMIVYGAGLSNPNEHLHDNLPTVIMGNAGGFIKTGRNVVYRRETPMCNLFLSMMERMGLRMEHFGDSTGYLDSLNA